MIIMGQSWENKVTGKTVVITEAAHFDHEFVGMKHESGRTTRRQRNLFLHDWKLIK